MKLLKTRIYIDGYNLYYGCLKNTSYKWLDLKQVILKILATVYFGEPEDQFEFELHESRGFDQIEENLDPKFRGTKDLMKSRTKWWFENP